MAFNQKSTHVSLHTNYPCPMSKRLSQTLCGDSLIKLQLNLIIITVRHSTTSDMHTPTYMSSTKKVKCCFCFSFYFTTVHRPPLNFFFPSFFFLLACHSSFTTWKQGEESFTRGLCATIVELLITKHLPYSLCLTSQLCVFHCYLPTMYHFTLHRHTVHTYTW